MEVALLPSLQIRIEAFYLALTAHKTILIEAPTLKINIGKGIDSTLHTPTPPATDIQKPAEVLNIPVFSYLTL